MDNKILLLSLLFILVSSACKKDKPAPPEPDFTGCKLTGGSSVTSGKAGGGQTLFYKGGNLYSINNTDPNGQIETKYYSKYKFSDGRLVESGRVSAGSYITERQFAYDNSGRVVLIKFADQSTPDFYSAYSFYYDNSGCCQYILAGSVRIINGKSNAEITDSIAYRNFISSGKPKVQEHYKYQADGTVFYTGGYNYEYDGLGNCTKVIFVSLNTERLMYEFEYDLTQSFNVEYLEFTEIMNLVHFSISSNQLAPIKGYTEKYPRNKNSWYDSYGKLDGVSRLQYKFDNQNRYIGYALTLDHQPRDTTYYIYTYTCK